MSTETQDEQAYICSGCNEPIYHHTKDVLAVAMSNVDQYGFDWGPIEIGGRVDVGYYHNQCLNL